MFELNRSNQAAKHAQGDALLFGPNDRWVATSYDAGINFWHPRTGRWLGSVADLSPGCLQPLPQGETFFGFDQDFRLIDVKSTEGTLSAVLEGPYRPTVPDSLRSWFPDGFTGKQWRSYPVRIGGSASGQIAAAVCGERCLIFNLASNSLQAITSSQGGIKYVAVNPDGRWVATGGWHTPIVKVWNAANGEEVASLNTENSANVAFSPDGRWLVTSTGKEYRFWNVKDWSSAHRIRRPANDDLPGPISFSPDSKLLALAYTRAIIRIVTPNTGTLLAQLEPIPGNDLVAFNFNSDASELAVTRIDAPTQVWHIRRIREQLAELSLDW